MEAQLTTTLPSGCSDLTAMVEDGFTIALNFAKVRWRLAVTSEDWSSETCSADDKPNRLDTRTSTTFSSSDFLVYIYGGVGNRGVSTINVLIV